MYDKLNDAKTNYNTSNATQYNTGQNIWLKENPQWISRIIKKESNSIKDLQKIDKIIAMNFLVGDDNDSTLETIVIPTYITIKWSNARYSKG